MRPLFAVCAAATVLAAQPPTDPQTVIRTTTRLVEIDVVAHDSHGAARNLTKDDLAVFDNGKRQAVAVFEKRAMPAAGTAPADTVTNAPADRAGGSEVSTVILLDALNCDP